MGCWTGWMLAALVACAAGWAREVAASTASSVSAANTSATTTADITATTTADITATTTADITATTTAPLPGPLPAARGEGVPGTSGSPTPTPTPTLDVTPPSAPGALAAKPLGASEVLLSWTPSEDDVGVAGYELVRGGRVVAGTPSLAAREKGLRAFAEYCWTVRALDAAGNRSAPSAPACARTLDTTPPSAPQYLAARPSSDRSVDLVWRPSTDDGQVAGYDVLRDGAPVLQTEDAAAEDRELVPGVRHCWTVRARDAAGNASDESQPACAVPPDLTPPSTPRLAAAPLSSSAVAVRWEAADDDVGVVGYELVRDGGAAEKVSGTEAEATGLAPASRHCFAVRALDAAGHRSELSDPVCLATPAPSPAPPGPRRLRATAASARAVRLAWEPSSQPGVVYRLSWDDGKGIGATRRTTFTAVGLRPGERHCYRVAAVDEDRRESPPTLEACAGQ